MTNSKYVNFFTDFAFKRLFGSEVSKPILLDFLNELLYQEQGRIVSLTYLKNEQLGRSEYDRKAVYDLYCENEHGEKFIVEIQHANQKYFKDRTLFYSTFPIVEQAQKGDWDYNLTPIYVIAIMGFVFDEDKDDTEKYRYNIKLSDIDTGNIFYDKLTFIYLAMPKFTKTEAELTNRFEKWLYILKNLPILERIPDSAREAVFQEFFRLAEVAQFSREEYADYNASLKVMWDTNAVLSTAVEKAKAEGLAKGLAEGLAEGEAKGLYTALLACLTYRFGSAPASLSTKLSNIHDVRILRTLTTEAFAVTSLADFETRVEALQTIDNTL